VELGTHSGVEIVPDAKPAGNAGMVEPEVGVQVAEIIGNAQPATRLKAFLCGDIPCEKEQCKREKILINHASGFTNEVGKN
jgi:hypothetical protein